MQVKPHPNHHQSIVLVIEEAAFGNFITFLYELKEFNVCNSRLGSIFIALGLLCISLQNPQTPGKNKDIMLEEDH